VAISGDSAGIMGAKASEAHGQLAALGALHRLGAISATERDQKATAHRRDFEHEIAPRPFLDQLYQPHPAYLTPEDATIVCRCEEVTAGQIREYVNLGCLGPNQTKAFGRPGMGPCQGRVCGLTVSEIIADARGVSPDEVGYYRIRSPVKPVTLGELAAMAFPDEPAADHNAE
jgi:bacterioferritin-associated ferredoxin